MYEQLQPVLQDFVVTVLTGVLAVASGFLVALAKKGIDWVSAKIETVKSDKLREDTLDAVDKLESIVMTTVISLQQTLGDDIKESLTQGDGKYSKSDLLALKDKAVSSVENQLSASTVELLNTLYPDLRKMISDLIESTVRSLKFSERQGVALPLLETCDEENSTSKKLLNE